MGDAELVRILQERLEHIRGSEHVLVEALAARVAEDMALTPALRDLAEGLLDVTNARLDGSILRMVKQYDDMLARQLGEIREGRCEQSTPHVAD